jgi:L-ascorbate 6-phosphate lactonase
VPGVELWWLGQAGFRLRDTDRGAVVFCDPFLSWTDERRFPAPEGAEAALAEADLVLVSHEHMDHLDVATLERAARDSRFTVVAPRPVVDQLRGVPSERIVGAQPGDALAFDGVRVWPVPARHGVNVADAYTFGEQLSGGLVRYLGYVVEIGGARIYHAGDCTPYDAQTERLRELHPDIALLPINGRDYFRETEHNIVGNMDHREAARLAHEIGVDLLIPMHWELFATNRGYPYQLVQYVEQELPSLSVLVPGRHARFIYTPPAR